MKTLLKKLINFLDSKQEAIWKGAKVLGFTAIGILLLAVEIFPPWPVTLFMDTVILIFSTIIICAFWTQIVRWANKK